MHVYIYIYTHYICIVTFFCRSDHLDPSPLETVAQKATVLKTHNFFRDTDICMHIYIYISTYLHVPGTQMTSVLIGKGLLLEVSNPKIEDVHRFHIYIYLHIVEKPFFSHRSILKPWLSRCLRTTNQLNRQPRLYVSEPETLLYIQSSG